MLQSRVIPCLLLKKEALVKTVKFKKANYIGDPINTVRIFNEKEVDELVFLDISARKENRPPNFNLVQEIANECFMPFAYGGGITKLDEAKRLFDIGVEKLVFNRPFFESRELLMEIAKIYGSQSVVVSVDIKKDLLGRYRIYNYLSRRFEKLKIKDIGESLLGAGVGELFLTSVDREGTMEGYDIELTEMISSMIDMPLVANGGARGVEDFEKVLKKTHASAAAAGSRFVYHGPHRAVLINYPKREELEKFNLIEY